MLSSSGTEAGQGFEQGLGTGGTVQIFTCAGAHAGHDTGGPGHLAIGEDGNLLRSSANQFDGVDGALGVVRRYVNDYNFRARILKLAEDGIGWPSGKTDVAKHRLAQARGFQTILQRG